MTFSFADHYHGNLTWLPSRTIFLTKHGSQAYGTSTPTSDLDVKGIAIPPKEILLGFAGTFEQAEIKGDPDVVIYDLRKFLSLAADCNPNIIEVLFTNEEDWLKTTPAFELLHKNADLFLSRKARFTFSGYAISQLKRIRTHKRWLLEPPTHKPTREEYGLGVANKAINSTDMGAYEKLLNEGHTFSENVMIVLQKEKTYHNALTEWTQYETWKRTRNEKRAAMEAQFGYDVKHGMHLVRLMRMCKEILVEGKVHVRRPDAEELKAIRAGAWSYERLISWAEEQEAAMSSFMESSPLPAQPDKARLNALCVELIEKAL